MNLANQAFHSGMFLGSLKSRVFNNVLRINDREPPIRTGKIKIIDKKYSKVGIRKNKRGYKDMDTKIIAKKIAQEAIVLLKNKEKTLPLSEGMKIAFFGRAQIGTFYSGNGSGAAHVSGSKNILEECEKNGISAVPELKDFYQKQIGAEEITQEDEFDWTKIKDIVNSGIMYEIFGRYHPPLKEYEVSEELLRQAMSVTNTAILVLSRNAGGEECDRHLHEDYELTASEKLLADKVCSNFERVILILNTNGLIDLSWTTAYPSIKSILFIGIPGEQGAAALADILTGKVNPSGKLPVTIAARYDDYPAARHFSWNKDQPDEILTYESYGLSAAENGSIGFEESPVTVYQEDIYTGYRYFDTFEREPLFAFGSGLSYTEFELGAIKLHKRTGGAELEVLVENVGGVAGKEVVQFYVSAVGTKSERVFQELKGFEKTKLLEPGGQENVRIYVPWEELGCYVEHEAAYVIEQGEYVLRIGNSSRNTEVVGSIRAERDIVLARHQNHLKIKSCNQDKLTFLKATQPAKKLLFENAIFLTEEDVLEAGNKYGDVVNDVPDQDLADYSIEQLAALCVGYGPGTPFSAIGQSKDPETIYDKEGKALTTNNHPTGFNGYVSPAMEMRGISSVFYKDGPAGIGELAWPTEMLIGCAFNKELWYEFGDAVGAECERQQVDIWLAPAVNLHRNPLCGRNFEYFSEDPYLTGVCAVKIAHGVQQNHSVLVCPKHFAVNEQETYRRGNSRKNYDAVDSIIRERALRELYLKPFEMLVKDAGISCIMTSFNKINGVFAGGSRELCTDILRGEWGFNGAVVTDWGDMDIVVDGADAVAAGNDIVMPGGPPVIAQILTGYREGRVSRRELESAVWHLKLMIQSRL